MKLTKTRGLKNVLVIFKFSCEETETLLFNSEYNIKKSRITSYSAIFLQLDIPERQLLRSLNTELFGK